MTADEIFRLFREYEIKETEYFSLTGQKLMDFDGFQKAINEIINSKVSEPLFNYESILTLLRKIDNTNRTAGDSSETASLTIYADGKIKLSVSMSPTPIYIFTTYEGLLESIKGMSK